MAATTAPEGKFSYANVERPTPGGTEVLVRVEAIGVNPADWKSRDADLAAGDPAQQPGAIIGWDLAGTVAELGPGVTRFDVGDRVFGMPRFPAPGATYAQYATAPSRQLARIPEGVPFEHAGAIPLAGLTAWQALVDTANVGAGDRVLIHGGSGGVGHLAVQIAVARGAEVWATASAANHSALRELGAHHLIDYRTQQFDQEVSELDVVLGLAGGPDTAVRSLNVLKPGGRFVAVGVPPAPPDLAAEAGVDASFMLVEPDRVGLEELAGLMAAGDLTVTIAARRPLAQMAELHAIGAAGAPLGKLVATVHHDSPAEPNDISS